MVHGVFDPQYQGYGEKFLVRSYLKYRTCLSSTGGAYVVPHGDQISREREILSLDSCHPLYGSVASRGRAGFGVRCARFPHLVDKNQENSFMMPTWRYAKPNNNQSAYQS
jgi:hypothetical protein